MSLRTTRNLFVSALFFAIQVSAQNITASTCVAPNAFTLCLKPLDLAFADCINKEGTSTKALLKCSCAYTFGELTCAMTNCWNVVYGCEYQVVANAFAMACDGPVPFFPAPDNAPGGCSCNLGYVSYNTTQAELTYASCITADVYRNDGCTCCAQAAGYAALYDICPNTSPSYVGFPPGKMDTVLDVLDPNLKQGGCASALAKYDCSSLGHTGLGVPVMTSYNPATLGKQSLSNTNTRTVTSPVSGATFTWTVASVPFVIVAASANARASSGSSTVQSNAAQSSAAQSTGTQSGDAQSTTSAKSEAHRIMPSQVMLTLLGMAAAALAQTF